MRSKYGRLNFIVMSSFTYLLLEGEKVQMEVHPDEINTVEVTLEDGSIIYAVDSAAEERKLLEWQMIFFMAAASEAEEKKVISLMQPRDECLAA